MGADYGNCHSYRGWPHTQELLGEPGRGQGYIILVLTPDMARITDPANLLTSPHPETQDPARYIGTRYSE